MKQSINVPFSINDKDVSVDLFYNMDTDGDIHVISCKVDVDSFDANLWHWLEVRTFQLRSMLLKDGYAQLYTENDNVKSSETIMFIECAYNCIMAKEQLQVAAFN